MSVIITGLVRIKPLRKRDETDVNVSFVWNYLELQRRRDGRLSVGAQLGKKMADSTGKLFGGSNRATLFGERGRSRHFYDNLSLSRSLCGYLNQIQF